MMSEQSTTQKIASMATKPILNAAATYLGCKLLGIEGPMNSRYTGSRDAAQQLAIGSAISSLGTEVVHSYVLPEVGQGNIYNSASMILAPVLQGAFLTLYAVESHPNKAMNIGYNKILMLGVASEVGASYANASLVQPWLHGN